MVNTMKEYRTLINNAVDKCLMGNALSVSEIVELLDIPIGSEADSYLQKEARRVSSEITGDNGCIWCAVGMDFAPCSMNCEFCSFGEEWGLIDVPRHVTEDEIIEHVRNFAEGGAAYVILRTTEFYNLETLLDYVPRIRKEVPGDYEIVLNTGELDTITAQRFADNGVYGVYHARRLGEGKTTPFDPVVRISTMQSVGASDLSLISLVEPIGEEHSNLEIAQAFADIVSCGAYMSGVMARFPVKGTPLGEEPMISEDRIAHIVAALRLSGGRTVQDICSHPATEKIVSAGANVLVVEAGAIPRDSSFSEKDWAGVNMANGRELLEKCGYTVSRAPKKAVTECATCACNGGNLDKFMQPIILHILSKKALNGYKTQKAIAEYATFDDKIPDMAATYRFLKNMEGRGLLSIEDGKYSLTREGHRCFMNWKSTLENYSSTLQNLLKQLQ